MSEQGKAAPIRVAVIGQGRSGYDIHVARMKGDKRFAIVAVADFEKDRREYTAAEIGCDTYRTHRELLDSVDAELVVVSTYSFTHAKVAIEALEAGFNVLVEKPLAMDTRWFDKMLDARDKVGKLFFPFHNYRFFPETVGLRAVMDEGILGEIFEIRMRALGFSRRNDWQTLREYGGGVLNNTCPHFLDLLIQMLEAPVVEEFTDLKLVQNVGDVENHVRVIMRAANGRIADMLVSSVDAFAEPKWTILGSTGSLISDGRTMTIRSFDEVDLPPYEVRRGPSLNRAYDFGDNKVPLKEETREFAPAPGDYYDNVYSVMREGGEQVVKLEDVRDVVRISEKARKKSGFYGGANRGFNPKK